MAVTACCIVQTTLDGEDKAEALASALLEQKLAACIQIAPVQSRYLWRGVFMREKEYLLSIKARAADFDAIAAQIRALHSYDVPEIIAVPILGRSGLSRLGAAGDRTRGRRGPGFSGNVASAKNHAEIIGRHFDDFGPAEARDLAAGGDRLEIAHAPGGVLRAQARVEGLIALRGMSAIALVRPVKIERAPGGKIWRAPSNRPSVAAQGEIWIMLRQISASARSIGQGAYAASDPAARTFATPEDAIHAETLARAASGSEGQKVSFGRCVAKCTNALPSRWRSPRPPSRGRIARRTSKMGSRLRAAAGA